MEHPYSNLPDVPRISLLDGQYAVILGITDENQWNIDAHDTLLQGLRTLRQDHESGAKELATNALAVLLNVAKIAASAFSTHEYIGRTDEEQVTAEDIPMRLWKYTVRKCGWALARYGRPSMDAAITSAIVKALQATVCATAECDTCYKPDSVQDGLQMLQNQLQLRESAQSGTEIGIQLRNFIWREFNKGAADGSENLQVKILTLSSSSTIKKALGTVLELELHAERVRASRRHLIIELRIMESRPLCEGVSMARELVKMANKSGYTHMLRIEIASDASVAMLASDVDVVLLGADCISDSGDVSNKMGSLAAVLCAKAMSKHALVVTVFELEKIAKPGKAQECEEEDNDVAEMTNAWGSKNNGELIMETACGPRSWESLVRVRNLYFEWVPAQNIHCYVCEDGPLITVDEVKERSKEALEAEKEVFSDFDSGLCSATPRHSSPSC